MTAALATPDIVKCFHRVNHFASNPLIPNFTCQILSGPIVNARMCIKLVY